jgi:hypothetical protein
MGIIFNTLTYILLKMGNIRVLPLKSPTRSTASTKLRQGVSTAQADVLRVRVIRMKLYHILFHK